MSFYIRLIPLLLALLLIGSFGHAQSKKRNSILFYNIDDWAEVYVNGKMVFKQAADAGHLANDVEFDLNPHIKNVSDPVVEIRLINGLCETCESGNGWTIEFEVFQNDESVDYIIEEGDSLGGDVVFSIQYEWGYI